MSAYSATAAAALLAGGASARAGTNYTAANIQLTGPSTFHAIDINGDGANDVSFFVNSWSSEVGEGGGEPFFSETGTGSSRRLYGMMSRWTYWFNSVSATAGYGGQIVRGVAGAAALDASVQVGMNNSWTGTRVRLATFQRTFSSGSWKTYSHTSNSSMTLVSSSYWGPNESATGYGSFLGQSGKYLGIEFQIDGQTHYGWVQIDVEGSGSDATITGYGYQDIAGAPTVTGVPEPGSLALLAIGAAGLAARRRKKAAA